MIERKIETERLIIRPINIKDAYDVFEWADALSTLCMNKAIFMAGKIGLYSNFLLPCRNL